MAATMDFGGSCQQTFQAGLPSEVGRNGRRLACPVAIALSR